MAIWDNSTERVGDIESVSADSTKCPNCAANLVFDVGHGACFCNNCGSLFDPESLDKVGSFVIDVVERSYDANAALSQEDEARVEVVCNSCGSQIISNKNTTSTFCAFCGSPALLTRRLTREFKPDYIIPFKIDKAKAVKIFSEYCEGVDHLPKDFRSEDVLSRMTGLYVPTWAVSTEVEVDIKGFGYTGKYVDSAYRKLSGDNTGSYSRGAYGRINFRFKDVPFDGEKHIADRLMSAAEPFDFSELVRFKAEYLQGFAAEKYDLLPIDMTDRIYRRLDKYSLSVCNEIKFGFDKFEPDAERCVTKYRNQEIKYVLLPVWFLSVEYNGIRYQYIVNGQTGKVSGEFPYEKKWEKKEQRARHSKVKSVKRNEVLRGFFIALPLIAIAIFFICVGGNEKATMFMLRHIYIALSILAVILLVTVILAKTVPNALFKKEKKDIEELSQISSHDLAPEPAAEVYYDPGYPVTAVETNSLFIPLESGWKYGERSRYEPFKIEHDIEEEQINEDATEFEKKGQKRNILQ